MFLSTPSACTIGNSKSAPPLFWSALVGLEPDTAVRYYGNMWYSFYHNMSKVDGRRAQETPKSRHQKWSFNKLKYTWHIKEHFLLLVVQGKTNVLTLFKPGFLAFYDRGGSCWFHPPPQKYNVSVELGQWNLAHVCTCQKTTPLPKTSSMFLRQRYWRFCICL